MLGIGIVSEPDVPGAAQRYVRFALFGAPIANTPIQSLPVPATGAVQLTITSPPVATLPGLAVIVYPPGVGVGVGVTVGVGVGVIVGVGVTVGVGVATPPTAT